VSFFEKLLGEESIDSEQNFIKSVTNQIAILFANRNDQYWAYDFKNKEIMPLHELFKLEYTSNEFLKKFAKTICAFDRRIEKVDVSTDKINGQLKLIIDATSIFQEKKIKIPTITLVL
jgi:hypothetical protein